MTFYYVTVMNENYAQPTLPDGVEADIVKGMYRYAAAEGSASVRLVGSGTILREVIAAAELLKADWGIGSEVWSATSFSELEREAREVQRWNRLHPDAPESRTSHVEHCLGGDVPVIAASDYLRAWPQLIAPYLQTRFTALGTDGFGRSDTRAALRSFFEVDRHHVVLAALDALADRGEIDRAKCAEAIRKYGIDPEAAVPWRA
jgi:pyruvate dehydrogenase E1 component